MCYADIPTMFNYTYLLAVFGSYSEGSLRMSFSERNIQAIMLVGITPYIDTLTFHPTRFTLHCVSVCKGHGVNHLCAVINKKNSTHYEKNTIRHLVANRMRNNQS